MSFLHKLKSKLGIGKTIYIPDCTTKFKTPEIYQNYKQLLRQTGIQFIELETHICSGDLAIDTGYTLVFEHLRQKNMELFQEHNITKIITNCPEAFKTFKEFYNIEVEHITETLHKAIDKLDKNHQKGEVTYHECYSLGEAPLVLLERTGLIVKQLPKTQCCGGYLLDHSPLISEECARQTIPKETKIVIASSPRCYLHLKESLPNIEIKELSQVLL